MNLDFQQEVVCIKRDLTASFRVWDNVVKMIIHRHLLQKWIDKLIQKRSVWIRRKLKYSAGKKILKKMRVWTVNRPVTLQELTAQDYRGCQGR